MKKLIAMLLAIVLCVGLLAACGGETGGDKKEFTFYGIYKAEGV